MFLLNKNILEYVEIVGTEPKSMIHDNEGHSIVYPPPVEYFESLDF